MTNSNKANVMGILRNKLKRREALTDTAFLLTITVSLFLVIYALSIVFLGYK